MSGEYWAIGLMTGTALDGYVDAALLRTDGENIIELGPYILSPYSEEDRKILADAVTIAREWNFNGVEPEILIQATNVIDKIYAQAVLKLISDANLKTKDIDYIGGHGLTVLHRPIAGTQDGRTLQLLNGQNLAQLTNIDVVWDFRSNDVANGGQGAPLAPIYHRAIMKYAGLQAPAAFLNLGGVGNVTSWLQNGDLISFDTGPANGPLNELIEQNGLGKYDKDGEIASRGKVDEAILNKILANPYFKADYPKSLDRYDFPASMVEGLSIEDGAATICAIIGETINQALSILPQKPQKLIAAGGGRKNPIIVKEIQTRAKVEIVDADKIGLRGDAIEAECFAFLGVRSALNLPISFPKTTGVTIPLTGGRIAKIK